MSHHIAELVNIAPNPQQPFVGASVFAHKAGLHTSAIVRRSDAYEHISPDLVGNGTRFVVSEMAGRSTLALKAEELGLELDSQAMSSVLDSLKRLEYEGYHFEVADGSLELLLRRLHRVGPGLLRPRVLPGDRRPAARGLSTEATVKVRVGDERIVATAEGNGPVNALDGAVRAAIGARYPALAGVHLVDYRVRVLDSARGTGSVTRVLIDSTDGDRTWTTIGVSENIIAASWQALSDSIVYGLLHAGATVPPTAAGSRLRPAGQPADNQEPLRDPAQFRTHRGGRPGPARLPADGAQHLDPVAPVRAPGAVPAGRAPARQPRSRPGVRPQAGPEVEDRLELAAGESAEDAVAGCTAVAMRRCCPVRTGPGHLRPDLRLHPVGLPRRGPRRPGGTRGPLFRSASHHYQAQRAIADSVAEETLRLTPEAVAERSGDWRQMLVVPPDA